MGRHAGAQQAGDRGIDGEPAPWWRVVSRAELPLAAFADLEMPILYLVGGRSPQPAHAVADVPYPPCATSESCASRTWATWRP